MKKIMLALCAVLVVGSAAFAGGFVSQKVVAPAGVMTNTIDNIPLNDSVEPFRNLEEFAFKNTSTGLVSVTVYSINMEDATAIASLSNIQPGATGYVNPQKAVLSGVSAGYIVTSGVATATATYLTNYVPYRVRTARVVYTQTLHDVPVTNWYQFKAK